MKYAIYVNYKGLEYQVRALKNENGFCLSCEEEIATIPKYDTQELAKGEIRQILNGFRTIFFGLTGEQCNFCEDDFVIKEIDSFDNDDY